jgi:hypothetical protein
VTILANDPLADDRVFRVPSGCRTGTFRRGWKPLYGLIAEVTQVIAPCAALQPAFWLTVPVQANTGETVRPRWPCRQLAGLIAAS